MSLVVLSNANNRPHGIEFVVLERLQPALNFGRGVETTDELLNCWWIGRERRRHGKSITFYFVCRQLFIFDYRLSNKKRPVATVR